MNADCQAWLKILCGSSAEKCSPVPLALLTLQREEFEQSAKFKLSVTLALMLPGRTRGEVTRLESRRETAKVLALGLIKKLVKSAVTCRITLNLIYSDAFNFQGDFNM